VALQERLTLRNLYLYLVCLVTLVISVFAAVSLVRSSVALLYPDPGYYGYVGPEVPGERGGITEEEQRRQEQLARDSERRYTVLELVSSGTTLLIAGPLYVYHWRRVQTEMAFRAGRSGVPDDAGTP
jgi:hypothetical protein